MNEPLVPGRRRSYGAEVYEAEKKRRETEQKKARTKLKHGQTKKGICPLCHAYIGRGIGGHIVKCKGDGNGSDLPGPAKQDQS